MRDSLAARARALGVETSYRNYKGDVVRSSPTAVEEIVDSINHEEPGGVTIVEGQGISVDGRFKIFLESGDVVEGRDDVSVPLPIGYHRIESGRGRSALIVAPRACVPCTSRSWGWWVQLYALRSKTTWGIGDLGALAELGANAREWGSAFLLINPMAYGPESASPYFPSSRLFIDPVYLDIAALDRRTGFDGVSPREGEAANTNDRVLKLEIFEAKRKALEVIWAQTGELATMLEFRKQAGVLLDEFAKTTEPGRPEFAIWMQAAADLQLARAAAEIPLIRDLPLGFSPDGVDAGLFAGSLAAARITAGAPPDEFSPQGQSWGFPPFDPWKLAATGFQPFIETIRANMRHAAGLRIDHVMSLFRLWWIPPGKDPAEGVYVRYPSNDLLNILALESARRGVFVIGEDLGTVEARVREEMRGRNILGYRVMLFESDVATYPPESVAVFSTHDLPTLSGVWTGDDLERLRELGLDPDERPHLRLRKELRRTGTTEIEALKASYAKLGSSPSVLVAASLYDALLERRRPNVPGTPEDGNWSAPLSTSLEGLSSEIGVQAVSGLLRSLRGEGGLNPK